MSWDPHLWDQYDSLSRYSQISIDCLSHYGAFVEKRSQIEYEYYSKLNSLSDSYIYKLNHTTSREPEIQALTWYKSLIKVFKSNKQLSNQHDTNSNLLRSLHDEIECFVQEINNEKGNT